MEVCLENKALGMCGCEVKWTGKGNAVYDRATLSVL